MFKKTALQAAGIFSSFFMAFILFSGTSSSSWPWFRPSSRLDSRIISSAESVPSAGNCQCLSTNEVHSLTVQRVEDPCSQPVPWCYVAEGSECPDSASGVHQRVDLRWSQLACRFEEQQEPKYNRRFNFFKK